MNMKTIAIGADHRGYEYKQLLKEQLSNYTIIDVGTDSKERCDFPVPAQAVCQAIQDGKAEYGILLCGSGIGMSIAANRFSGIYAALVWNVQLATLAKQHDNANILVIPADFVSIQEAQKMVQAWLETKFLGDRYQQRIDLIDAFSS